LDLNVVYKCSHWNIFKWKTVTCRKFCFFRNDKRVAWFYRFWKYHVSLLAIFVHCKPDECTAVRIVLDCFNGRWNIALVIHKVHMAEETLVPSSLVAHSDAALAVTAH